LAQGQELTGRKRRTKTSLQERKKEKTYLTLTGLLMEGLEHLNYLGIQRNTRILNPRDNKLTKAVTMLELLGHW
jgi:hypothetical protein